MFFWTTMLRMPFSVLRLLSDKFEGSSHIRLKIAAVERGTDKLLHKMLWFEGSIPAAIASAKQKNSVFVIFIAGDDDQSTQMLSSWEDDKVAEATAQSFVAIKIDAKSDTCVQFSQIYPVVCIPSSFFIGDNGIPLEVIAGSVPAEQLVNRIEKVKQMHIQQKNVKLGGADENQVATEQHSASLVTPDLTSQSQSLPSETVQPNGAHLSDAETENGAAVAASKACLSKTVEDGVHSGQPSPAEEISVSSEDASVSSQPEEDLNIKVERLTKKLEERREHKNREEESEIKMEVERRKVGKEILDFKKKNEGEKTKQMLEERNREKAEEKAARDRVKQQIALDRADRAARYAKTKEEVDAAMAAALQTRQAELVAKKQTSQKERSAIARIQFRLPDGSSITNQFPSETRLEEARQFVAQEVGKKYGNFSLATMFPRREFTIEDFDKTLLELELAPSAAIVLLPQTGRSAAAVVQSSGGGIWGVLGTIFYPLFAVWRFISNFVFASSPPPGSSTRQAPQPEHSQPSTSTAAEPKRETIRKRVLEKHTDDFKKDGKIYRLRTQGDNEDDNNTWNGNSTQQM